MGESALKHGEGIRLCRYCFRARSIYYYNYLSVYLHIYTFMPQTLHTSFSSSTPEEATISIEHLRSQNQQHQFFQNGGRQQQYPTLETVICQREPEKVPLQMEKFLSEVWNVPDGFFSPIEKLQAQLRFTLEAISRGNSISSELIINIVQSRKSLTLAQLLDMGYTHKLSFFAHLITSNFSEDEELASLLEIISGELSAFEGQIFEAELQLSLRLGEELSEWQ